MKPLKFCAKVRLFTEKAKEKTIFSFEFFWVINDLINQQKLVNHNLFCSKYCAQA